MDSEIVQQYFSSLDMDENTDDNLIEGYLEESEKAVIVNRDGSTELWEDDLLEDYQKLLELYPGSDQKIDYMPEGSLHSQLEFDYALFIGDEEPEVALFGYQ